MANQRFKSGWRGLARCRSLPYREIEKLSYSTAFKSPVGSVQVDIKSTSRTREYGPISVR